MTNAVIDMKTRRPVREDGATEAKSAPKQPRVPAELLQKMNAWLVGPLDVPAFPQVRFRVAEGKRWEKYGKARIYYEVAAFMGPDVQAVTVYFDLRTGLWGNQEVPEGLIAGAVRGEIQRRWSDS